MSESMRKVTKEIFFAAIGPLNVHPRPERDVVYWETPNRALIGKSIPGYMGGTSKEWFLAHPLTKDSDNDR